MGEQRITSFITVLNDIKNNNSHKNFSRKLNVEMVERIIKRLDSFSSECEECNHYLNELGDYILLHKEELEKLEKNSVKQYRQMIANITSHLQKNHQLVTQGYYLGIYISLSLSVGLIFGMVIFDNLAIGMSIGMLIGVVIGNSLDENAKKKGLMI